MVPHSAANTNFRGSSSLTAQPKVHTRDCTQDVQEVDLPATDAQADCQTFSAGKSAHPSIGILRDFSLKMARRNCWPSNHASGGIQLEERAMDVTFELYELPASNGPGPR